MTTEFHSDIAPFPKSGLIEVLSWRTYPSLVSALREVVSNASDADANHLNITLSRTYDAEMEKEVWKLTFFDDGEGMNLDDFKNYLRLSGIGRRDRTVSDATTSGRKIIGMLGIGSLAVAPWAERVEVLTKKKDNVQVLHAKIPYGKFFNNSAIRSRDLYGEDGEYQFEHRTLELQKPDSSEVENGFTIIDLVGLTDEAINELIDPNYQGEWEADNYGLLGDKYQEYLSSTKRGKRETFRKFPPLLRFMHKLALLIPVPYPKDTPLSYPPIKTMVNMINAQCMEAITFQGVKLQRPLIILDQQTEEDRSRRRDTGIASRGSQQGTGTRNTPQGIPTVIDETLPKSNVQIHGYIWGQNTQIKFEDLAGVQVRIKNVGIGSYNFSLFEPVEQAETASARAARREAISGEIFVDYSHELEKALRGDREGFQENSAVYRELKDAVYKHIKKLYSKIDALAPSRQATSGAGGSTATSGATTTGSSAADATSATSQTSTSTTATSTENEPTHNNGATQSEADTANQGTTDTASDASTTADQTRMHSAKEYRAPLNISFSPELPDTSEIALVKVENNELVVSLRDDLLPASLSPEKVEHVCYALATILVRHAAQQEGVDWTDLQAALTLVSEIEEASDAG